MLGDAKGHSTNSARAGAGSSGWSATTTTSPSRQWLSSAQRLSLLLLVLQNSALVMVMHHSRNSPTGSQPRYLTSTAVLVVELVKLSASLLLTTYDTITSHPSSSPSKIAQHLYHSILTPDSWKLIVPAALYTLQNSLVYTAISNLGAVTFQVTYQLKILTTVLFSIILLGRTISVRQWLGLILLTFGVALVQLSPASTPDVAAANSWTEKITSLFTSASQPPAIHHNALKGLAAVVGASLISGLTCVYFEKLLKDSLGSTSSSIWIKNVQLSFFSIFPALFIGVIWYDGANISQNGGFFAGYNAVVWSTICLQALGGLIVAVCIAYADNVVKNFAASLSIVVSYAGTAVVFGERMTLHRAGNYGCSRRGGRNLVVQKSTVDSASRDVAAD
ncbi:nucleotide-sugar transporter-domain-containing protein [Apiosordaria backusii]|uniref:Nucleotide-sugar transporter-domain-containing protein n=1 Tax=Apiosordaria backusii TaxID=314023 RepID=A0AA40BN71_9PEZI|nr:nucleotide-sugar transporter-domain-containing protein [Apiosordaria backusii]